MFLMVVCSFTPEKAGYEATFAGASAAVSYFLFFDWHKLKFNVCEQKPAIFSVWLKSSSPLFFKHHHRSERVF